MPRICGISWWRRFEARLTYTMDCGGHPLDKSVFHPSITSMVPVHRQSSNGRLSWLGRDLNQEHWMGLYARAGTSFDYATTRPIFIILKVNAFALSFVSDSWKDGHKRSVSSSENWNANGIFVTTLTMAMNGRSQRSAFISYARLLLTEAYPLFFILNVYFVLITITFSDFFCCFPNPLFLKIFLLIFDCFTCRN